MAGLGISLSIIFLKVLAGFLAVHPPSRNLEAPGFWSVFLWEDSEVCIPPTPTHKI